MQIKHMLVSTSDSKRQDWCYSISTLEEMETLHRGLNQQRTQSFLHNRIHTDNPIHKNVSLPELAGFEAELTKTWRKYIGEGETILSWHANGGYILMSKHVTIHDIVYLDYPEMPEENLSADIVVCENSPIVEEWWNKVLMNEFPSKSINVLTLFGEREDLQLIDKFNKASIISFTTTFSSYGWFERILDLLIKCGITGKTIYGDHMGGNWLKTLPSDIKKKVQYLEKNGTTFQVYQLKATI